MLFHPQPLAAANKIGSETSNKEIVDPRPARSGSSVVGIVLDVQPDETLSTTAIKYEVGKATQ